MKDTRRRRKGRRSRLWEIMTGKVGRRRVPQQELVKWRSRVQLQELVKWRRGVQLYELVKWRRRVQL